MGSECFPKMSTPTFIICQSGGREAKASWDNVQVFTWVGRAIWYYKRKGWCGGPDNGLEVWRCSLYSLVKSHQLEMKEGKAVCEEWWALGNLGKTTGSCRIIVAEENTLDIWVPLGWSCRQEMIKDQTSRARSLVSEYSGLTSVLKHKSAGTILWLQWGPHLTICC